MSDQGENGKAAESKHALLERLIKVLGMTSNDNDPTALMAARRANDILAKLETDWHSLLTSKVTIIADPFVNISAPPPKAGPPRDASPRKPTYGPFAASPQKPSATPTYTCAWCKGHRLGTAPHSKGLLLYCSQSCFISDNPAPKAPRWKPAPPPRFKDQTAIQVALDKINARPIRHQATMYRIQRIERDFKREGSIEQDDWSFLGGTASSLRGTKVTTDMI